MHTPRSLSRLTRGALVAVIALMGAALISILWTTQRSARDARTSMIRGQAAQANAAVRARFVDLSDAQPSATPAQKVGPALEAGAVEGVQYLAWLDADGAVIADAGQPTLAPGALTAWVQTARSAEPVRVGDRVRVVYKKTRPDRPPPPPGEAAPPPRRGPPGLVLELQPKLADDLDTAATWSVVIGTTAAATLLILVAILVRWSLRREDTVRAMEQARHLASLGQMSAVLAHEIRNPLASLKGNAQLLAQMLPDGERTRAKADRVVDEAKRLEHLTNDLLAFARSGELHVADTDPAALVRDAAAEVDGARVRVVDDAAPRTFPLDAHRMRQVLVNLIDNAAAMGDGPVEAAVERDGSNLRFTVRDHGPGLSDTDLGRVFEPFYTRRTRGTGLGLAVCKRVVELHGGAIAASNAVGGGAEFRITLPRR